MNDPSDLVPPPTDADLERVNQLLRRVGGENVVWGAVNVLEVLLTERRMAAERMATERLSRATWALVVSTAALVAVTLVLVVVTAQQGG